jgi:hypothetical protein
MFGMALIRSTCFNERTRGVSGVERPFDLLFTSPPYYGVVTYHSDQWLRGWLLGGEPRPVRNGGR